MSAYMLLIHAGLFVALLLLTITVVGNRDVAAENRSLRAQRDCLRARLADAELENVRLNEEADWAAVIAGSEHPSLGLVRPVAAVVSLDERRGGA